MDVCCVHVVCVCGRCECVICVMYVCTCVGVE